MRVKREGVSEAISQALRLRKKSGIAAGQSVNVYDLAERLRVEIRFLALPSMEGMFDAETKTIFVCSLRPAGRQAFTAAHELGHFVLGHGTHVSEFVEPGQVRSHQPEETAANAFAGALLMPKSLILSSFTRRGWNPKTPSPVEIYVIAGELGVGFTTLINHLRFGLDLLNAAASDSLLREGRTLTKIRTQLVGAPIQGNLIVLDSFWANPSLDLSVGDGLLLRETEDVRTNAPNLLEERSSHLFTAVRAGCGQIVVGDKQLRLRVAPAGYVGRSIFRFEPEDVID